MEMDTFENRDDFDTYLKEQGWFLQSNNEMVIDLVPPSKLALVECSNVKRAIHNANAGLNTYTNKSYGQRQAWFLVKEPEKIPKKCREYALGFPKTVWCRNKGNDPSWGIMGLIFEHGSWKVCLLTTEEMSPQEIRIMEGSGYNNTNLP